MALPLFSHLLPVVHQHVLVALSTVRKFGITAAYCSVYVYTVEFFPTLVRTSGVGVATFIGQIGGLVAPHIALLVCNNPTSQFLCGFFCNTLTRCLNMLEYTSCCGEIQICPIVISTVHHSKITIHQTWGIHAVRKSHCTTSSEICILLQGNLLIVRVWCNHAVVLCYLAWCQSHCDTM